ncbi:MAG: nucleoside phosphorylase, partial [bacterium]|nr:nucleoside phosphorylase [bacterium]
LIKAIPDLPKSCVICFFQNVIDHLDEQGKITEVKTLRTEMGEHPVYTLQYNDRAVTLFHPGIGAPLATGLFEEVIALGCETFIVCGGAGVLEKDIAVGHLLIPTTAIRDEGTSYHYLAPGREVSATPEAVEAIESTLKQHDIEYLLTKTWTTDAFYRETPQKIALRRSEGCLTVEM